MDEAIKFFEYEKQEKIEIYRDLNRYIKKDAVLFTGSSLMEQLPIYEFIQNYDIKETIYNRGIGGFTTSEMLEVMDVMVFDLEPSKIFINIGSNDLSAQDFSKNEFLVRYETILKKIIETLPKSKIYVMAYYPINGEYDFGNDQMRQVLKIRTNERINEVNHAISQIAQKYQLRFINVNTNLTDEKGNLKHEYSKEGMHMYPSGYKALLDDLMIYVRE